MCDIISKKYCPKILSLCILSDSKSVKSINEPVRDDKIYAKIKIVPMYFLKKKPLKSTIR